VRLAVVAALAALVTPGSAGADDGSDGSDDGLGSTSRPLRVRVELVGAVAKLQVTALVDLDEGASESIAIDLPARAVVTGGTVRSGKTRRPLVLASALDTSDRIEALATAARSRSMATAIAIVQPEFGPLEITALVPRAMQLVLELELEAATCFSGDQRHLAIPTEWASVLERSAGRVSDELLGDEQAINPIAQRCSDAGASPGWNEGARSWLSLPTTERSSKPAGDDRIGTLAGRFVHGAIQAARLELALAGTLTEVASDLATAFVIDGSRSVEAGMVETERAVIASYLRHAPRSAVQVIAFDRAGRALLPDWARARTAARTIDRALHQLVPRNGSDLDAGLAEAARWLRDRTGTRRVVVFTDELFPERLALLDPARLATVLPAGTVVHVVSIASGAHTLDRDDDGLLAPLAAATAGIAMSTIGSGDQLDALALVRPISLDHVRVIAPGYTALETAPITGTMCVDPAPGSSSIDLAEGSACTWWAIGPASGAAITVEGLVWGRRWRQVVELGDARDLGVAREMWSVLDHARAPELLAAADLAARAVNSQWSLLATWGGDGGYAEAGVSLSGSSGCGCGGSMDGGFGSHTGTVRYTGPTVDDQVAGAIAACRKDVAGATIELAIETTQHEIVGVAATIGGVTGEVATRLDACVETPVWDLALWRESPREHG
jgi:hypothetical protein